MALVSRLAENLNSNICDGYGQRQQMDVWFCVPPQEPKTKAPGKELQKHTSHRALRARHEDPRFALDFTYHGCPIWRLCRQVDCFRSSSGEQAPCKGFARSAFP